MSSHSGDAGNFWERSEQFRHQALEMHQQAQKLRKLGRDAPAQQAMTNSWAMLDEALKLCPSNHRARFLKASYAMNVENYELAKAESMKIYAALSREQVLGMHDSLLHLTIAHASKMLGDKDDALRFACEASQLFPKDPQVYMIYAELLDQAGETMQAEQMCRQALFRNGCEECVNKLSNENVYFTLCCLGSNLLHQGKYSEAEVILVRAVQLDSTCFHAYDHLSEVYHCQGRHKEAFHAVKKAAEHNPTDHSLQTRVNAFQAALQDAESPVTQDSARTSSIQSEDGQLIQPLAAHAMDYHDIVHNPDKHGFSKQKSYSDCSTADSMRLNEGGHVPAQRKMKKQKDQGLEDSWFACCFDRM